MDRSAPVPRAPRAWGRVALLQSVAGCCMAAAAWVNANACQLHPRLVHTALAFSIGAAALGVGAAQLLLFAPGWPVTRLWTRLALAVALAAGALIAWDACVLDARY